MSYDVTIGDDWLNYTSNLARLFYDHIPETEASRGGLHELNGKTGADCLPILKDAFDRLNHSYCDTNSTRAFRARYDAPNGWGSTDGALIYLARIMARCALNPEAIVEVDS